MEPKPLVLGDWTWEIPIYNGAGTVKSTEQVRAMAESNACAVTGGSYTFKERSGNEGDVFWVGPEGSINSLGIPNGGYPYCMEEIPKMARICHDHGKAFIASVQGDNPEEFGCMAGMALGGGADFCELNLACPNIWNDGTQKGIFGFYPELIQQIMDQILRYKIGDKKIFLKVPPYSDPKLLTTVADLVANHHTRLTAAVVIANTFPNSFMVRRRGLSKSRPAISFGKGFGGFAGAGYHAIALGQCKQWSEALAKTGNDIKVIGVGGVRDGETAADFFQFASASAVQVVTALFRDYEVHPPVLGRIISELLEVPELA